MNRSRPGLAAFTASTAADSYGPHLRFAGISANGDWVSVQTAFFITNH